jgi:hypothetical protein
MYPSLLFISPRFRRPLDLPVHPSPTRSTPAPTLSERVQPGRLQRTGPVVTYKSPRPTFSTKVTTTTLSHPLDTMLSPVSRALRHSIPSTCAASTSRRALAARPTLLRPSAQHLASVRWSSVSVPNSKLDSVPSPAEGVGVPAVDKSKGKVWDSADEAVKDIKNGSLLLSAGESSRTPRRIRLLLLGSRRSRLRFRAMRDRRDHHRGHEATARSARSQRGIQQRRGRRLWSG